jgi:DNA-binding beta-propeller fold protein YncE
LALLALSRVLAAQSYTPPAGDRPAIRRSGTSILPGGRIISPMGEEYVTGPGPFGIALSPSGKVAATANGGPWRYGITILERGKQRWDVRQLAARSMDALDQFGPTDWRSVCTGVVFSGEHNLYVAEGNSGRISLFDSSDERRRVVDLNQGGYHDSYTGDLAFDGERNILYVVDQANARVVAIDGKTRQILTSVKAGRLPFAMALSPDRQKLYVTNVGLLEYGAIANAGASDPRAAGLAFPAFGFPSAEAVGGGERSTAQGMVRVPGLGDPHAPAANSLCVIDVSNPAAAQVAAWIPIGGSPSGVAATADRVFVSGAGSDAVTIIDAQSNRVVEQIPIRIPGLEQWRGVVPIGLAYHEKSGWLLVAEAGINAVGVIDVAARRVLGHLPAGWYPTRVAIDRDTVFVTNAKGHGQGPSGPTGVRGNLWPAQRLQGTVAIFPVPPAAELAARTAFVMQANGFQQRPAGAGSRFPAGVRHVVLIVKEGRSYDDVLGDIAGASNGPALGMPELAHLGAHGAVDGRHVRMSLRDVNVTPNHHAIARQWSFSDNFYADGDASIEGHHWLAGVYPNAWTASSVAAALGELKDFRLGTPGRMAFAGTAASVQPEDEPEAGTLWQHLASHGVSFHNFGEGFELAGVLEGSGMAPLGARFLTNMPMPEALYRNTSREYPGFNVHISDQYRVSQFIREVDEKFVKGGEELPQFLYIYLPGDYNSPPRPEDGYPYEESFVADNDYALGRIMEYLSGTKWWGSTAVFVTEADAEAGVDHVDAHRTILLCAGPWVKKNYVAHTNTSFPGLLKTIFGLLHLPALNLFDATAADLADCFAAEPDMTPYHALAVDKRVFDPSLAPGPASSKVSR